MTAYQACINATTIAPEDRRFIKKHVESCPTCLEASDHPRCRVTNCRTLDAITDFMVEQLYPAEPSMPQTGVEQWTVRK